MIVFFVTFILAAGFLVALTQKFNATEQKAIWLAYIGHAIAAIGQVMVTLYYYQGGDMLMYHRLGMMVAKVVRDRPSFFQDLLQLAAGARPYHFEWVLGAGSSTGAMSGIAGILCLVTNDSLVASCFLVAIMSLVGQVLFYLAFRNHLPRPYHTRALFACLLIPSVVFWSSGILKESIAIFGLGLAVFGISNLVKSGRPTLGSVGPLLLGFWIVGIFKAYVLFPFTIASLLWFFAERSRRAGKVFRLKPTYIVVGLAVSLAAIIGLGEVYPRFALERVAEETAALQGAYRHGEAGSTFELGDPSARTMSDQLVFTPIALVSSLLRPFIFEVHNIVSFFNALETTLILGLVFRVLSMTGLARALRTIRSEPLLLFCLVYVFVFAIAVGLAAPNLGTLSRYRIPMFPAYWLLVLCLLPRRRTALTKRRDFS